MLVVAFILLTWLMYFPLFVSCTETPISVSVAPGYTTTNYGFNNFFYEEHFGTSNSTIEIKVDSMTMDKV